MNEIRIGNQRVIAFQERFLIVLLAMACSVLAAAEPRSNARREEYGRRLENFQRSIDRHIDISPTQINEGINSGMIILFGHPIRRPYRIEFDENRMLINGVVVDPSPVKVRHLQRTRKPATQEQRAEAHKVVSLIRDSEAMYKAKYSKMSEDALKATVFGFVKNHDFVKSAEWTSKERLRVLVTTLQGPMNIGIRFSSSAIVEMSTNTAAIQVEAVHRQYINELETQLRHGECEFFFSDGGNGSCDGIHDEERLRNNVVDIMSDKGLSSEEKISKLRETFGGNLSAALDVSSNYKPIEWVKGEH